MTEQHVNADESARVQQHLSLRLFNPSSAWFTFKSAFAAKKWEGREEVGFIQNCSENVTGTHQKETRCAEKGGQESNQCALDDVMMED